MDYLTRLEQGRDRSPAVQALAALAETLSLSRDERIHLHRLAKTAVALDLLTDHHPTTSGTVAG